MADPSTTNAADESGAFATDQIVVAVRVRPLNERELAATASKKSALAVKMDGQKTTLLGNITSKEALSFEERSKLGSHVTEDRHFTFDFSMWSADPADAHFVSQEAVYARLGVGLLRNAFKGYNACIFAYGQTGSGKTHTMMGPAGDAGLIPRICNAMFEKCADNKDPHLSYKIECSYMEIYNERVRDLLAMDDRKTSLRVREHNVLGPYVDGLRAFAVNDYAAIEALIAEGTKCRVTAATAMNDTSSRSHAVFTITITQSQYDPLSQNTGEKTSRVSLVDLAGSERVSRTGAEGDRLKEGGSINKSLHTLGLVISGLADIASGKCATDGFVPFRDSVLTWLLKENLGGNSKTVMIANISPSADSYDETLSTLRYADCAKRIRTHAVVNEDANARVIHELRDEVERLRAMLSSANRDGVTIVSADQLRDLRERLAESERLMMEKSLSWEERLRIAQAALEERQRRLDEMGISVQGGGISVDAQKMYLLNLSPSGAPGELTVYYLKDTVTRIGTAKTQDIVLAGPEMVAEHCILPVEGGKLAVLPLPGGLVAIDGVVVESKTPLPHGCTLRLGASREFRVSCPRDGSTSLAPRDQAEDDPSKDLLSGTGTWPGSKFHLACEKGELGLVQLMLTKKEATPNSEDARWKRAPIMLAADYGHLSVCQLLLRHGADPGKPDERGYCPLHACCDTGHLDVVKLLVTAGAPVNFRAEVGCTPLHRAADQGHLAICEFLLDQGADVNIRDRKGWSALLLATYRGHVDVCKLLVSRGADVKALTQYNETVLHMAAHIACVPLIELYLAKGADATVEQLYRRTAYDYASETSSFSLLHARIEFLLNREAACKILHAAQSETQRKERNLEDRKTIVIATSSTASTLPLPVVPPRTLTTVCIRPTRPVTAAGGAPKSASAQSATTRGRPASALAKVQPAVPLTRASVLAAGSSKPPKGAATAAAAAAAAGSVPAKAPAPVGRAASLSTSAQPGARPAAGSGASKTAARS